MDELDLKTVSAFEGKVVRKDLVRQIKVGANVPVYVLEYLLGKYCSSTDETIIQEGIRQVKEILSEHYVRPDQTEKIKSDIRERRNFRIIDKVRVRLVETEDRYWAQLVNLNIDHVNIEEHLISRFDKLLGGGLWAVIDMDYSPDTSHKGQLRPFRIREIKPIQLAGVNMADVKSSRDKFTTEDWIDLLIRSIGMQSEQFSHRTKLLLLCRLIPLVEANFNLVELGPRGTGKSFAYRELSPYSILVSGGKTTVANLFVHLGTGRVGLVGIWDTIAFDEVAGVRFKEVEAVQILKDYMESGSFSRGKEQINASGSLAFLGNISLDVKSILKNAHLFSPFPPELQDLALIDRFHIYIPGWEIPKMRPDSFCSNYGFVSDYLAEFLREMRKETYSDAIDGFFTLGNNLSQRDVKAIRKTVSGLVKLIHPNGNYTKEELEEYLTLALEMRRRVKEQLKRMGGVEYWAVNFTYSKNGSPREIPVTVPEMGMVEKVKLPSEPKVGEVMGLAITQSFGTLQCFEVVVNKGTGRLIPLGYMMRVMKESLKAAYEYVSHNQKALGIGLEFKKDYDISVLATQMGVPKEGPSAGITILTGLVSALTNKPVRNDVAMTGEITIMGKVLGVGGIQEKLVAAMEAGIKRVYVPKENEKEVDLLPQEVKQALEIKPVERVEEVLSDAIIGYIAPV